MPLGDAATWVLRNSGVKFRTLVRADGTTERWRQPRLASWEVPRTTRPSRGPSIRKRSHRDARYNDDGEHVA
jgi:hypothetical protein